MAAPLRHPLLLLALVVGLFPAVGLGATSLELARQQARASREALTSLRERQMALRGELNGLAYEIEAEKAQGARRPSSGLESRLRRSQEVSTELTSLLGELTSAEARAQQAAVALHAALSEELSSLQDSLEAAAAQARREPLKRMRRLRAEREALRSLLPQGSVPSLEPRHSEDPADLYEQADALRDTRDKAARRRAEIETRLTQLREERALEQRLGRFLEDERRFDDRDRRIGLGTSTAATTFVPSADSLTGPQEGREPGLTSAPPPIPRPSDERRVPSSDLRDRRGPGDDLAGLESERARLLQLEADLDRGARTLEERARELR